MAVIIPVLHEFLHDGTKSPPFISFLFSWYNLCSYLLILHLYVRGGGGKNNNFGIMTVSAVTKLVGSSVGALCDIIQSSFPVELPADSANIRTSKCFAVVDHENPLSQGFHSGTHWLFLHCAEQKHWHEPPAVFPSSVLSVPSGHLRPLHPLGSWTFLFSATRVEGWGGVGAGLSVLSSAQAQQWTSCAAISTFIPLSPSALPSPALFCCFNHVHHGPISRRKSRALHWLSALTSSSSALHLLCI